MVLSAEEEKYVLHNNQLPVHRRSASSKSNSTKLIWAKYLISIALVVFVLSHLDTSSGSSAGFYTSQIPGGISSHRSVRWLDCSDASNPNFVCAYVNVPKDHTNASSGMASIAVSKLPATSKPQDKLGAIWLNPGGPGKRPRL